MLGPELMYLSLRFPRVYEVMRAGYHKARSGKSPVNQVSNDNSVQNSSLPAEEMTDREKVSNTWGKFTEKRVNDPKFQRLCAMDHPLIQEYILDTYFDGQHAPGYAMKYLNKVPSEWGLEIGCGPGTLSIGMARDGLCKRLDAFDISEKAIEIAKRSAEEQGIRTISFEVRDANTIRLPKNRYDLIFISQSLHHIENLENLYDQVGGALTDDGIFWASDYIGPARLQWTDKQLEIINAINALLPEKYRTLGFDETRVRTNVERIPLEAFLKGDPSEAVRSNEILPLAKEHLDVVEIRPWGHSITYPLLIETIHNYDENSEIDNALLRLICLLESMLIKEGMLESDFAFFVARKRR